MNVPEEELREMVGASLVPATEAVKEARVLVAGEELESVTPRSKTRFPMWRDCRRCFCRER